MRAVVPAGAAHAAGLTADGALTLRVESAALLPVVRRWLPGSSVLAPAAHALPRSRPIVVDEAAHDRLGIALDPTRFDLEAFGAASPPAVVFDGVTLQHAVDGRVLLRAPSGRAVGVLGEARDHARLLACPDADADEAERAGAEWAVFTMCTLAAALMLGRMARALVHAAAVVDPAGGAWLLVGDTHAGKTTTCATLLDAGWGYASDDHVVLRGAAGDVSGPGVGPHVEVEGWPRTFHLDRGWEDGTPAGGARGGVDAFARWPGAWRRTAPLCGVLMPRVRAAEPTRLLPATPADAFAQLVRQSPWLFADPRSAPALAALLRRVAALPAATLSLGRDSFRRPAVLADVLAGVPRPAPGRGA